MSKHPAELARHIEAEHKRTIEGNTADYRGTRQAQLDDITHRCEDRYARGVELISRTSREDLERCRRLYLLRNGEYSFADELTEARVGGMYVLVPAHFILLSEMRELRKAIL